MQGSNGAVDAVGHKKNRTTDLYRVKGLCRILILAWRAHPTQRNGDPIHRNKGTPDRHSGLRLWFEMLSPDCKACSDAKEDGHLDKRLSNMVWPTAE